MTKKGALYVWGEAPNGALGRPAQEAIFKEENQTQILSPIQIKVEALVENSIYSNYLINKKNSKDKQNKKEKLEVDNTVGSDSDSADNKEENLSDQEEFALDQKLKSSGAETSSNHSLALTKQGTVYSWGDGANGRLGLGVTSGSGGRIPTGSFKPQLIKFDTKIKKIEAGVNISMALAKNGKLFTWGRLEFEKPKFGDIQFQSIPQSIFPDTIIKMIACGYSHCMAVASSNELYSWGNGQEGCLGHGDQRNRSKPSEVASMQGKRISGLACGDRFSIILTDETRGLEPNQKITLKTVLNLTATKAIASKFLTKVRNNILQRNKKLRDKRLRNVQVRSRSSSGHSHCIGRQNTLKLPQVRKSRNSFKRQKSSSKLSRDQGSSSQFRTESKLPDILKGGHSHKHSNESFDSGKISKSFSIDRDGQDMQNDDNDEERKYESNRNDLVNEQTIKYFIEQNFLHGKKAHQLPKPRAVLGSSGPLYKQTLNANLLKFQYPDFFAEQFQISQIDKQLKASSVPDKAKVIDQIVHLLIVSEQASPLKIIKQIKKKYEVSTAARTQGLSVNDDDSNNNSPLIIQHNPYTLQRKKIGLSESTKKQKVDTQKMIKQSAAQLNMRNATQSPVKMKRLAMKMNLQLLIKKLNDQDLA